MRVDPRPIRRTPFPLFPLFTLFTLACMALACGEAAAQRAGPTGAPERSGLSYRYIGPPGNRVSAVVGVPGDPNVYYFGAASGGVFKTSDGGVHWTPVFDDQPAQSIGSLAIAPSDPDVVYAGTGETWIRSNVSIGNGIYRTTDGGVSWSHLGLESTGRIGRVVVHPSDPDIAYAAALGHLYGPQEERGVYRTTDGGETWERVLFVDERTGAVDVAMNPANPRILVAAMWEMYIRTWGRWSGGPGSGLFISRDGGDSWTRLEGRGLPTGPLGKIGLAMTPDDPDRIYALIETNANRDFAPLDDCQGVLWRSDDGGDSWRMVNPDHTLIQRPPFYTRAVAAPDNADEIHFLATLHTTSLDGGLTFRGGSAGGDNHDMWIDPLIPDRMIVGHDGGVSISTTRGESWMRPRLPIAQMYHVYADNRIPYWVMGNRQDGASMRGPSNSLSGGTIPIGAWHSVGGCESGFAVPDPVNPDVVWSGCYEGILDRYDHSTGHSRTVSVWPDNPEGWPAGELRYRFQWTFPVAISPHDHNRVYVGSQHVHRTTDGGHSWQEISPDLTTNDKTKQEKTGGLTPDDASPTYAAVLFAIAESPLEEGVIWVGSNDGLVHLTRDGGANWTNVTGNIPDLPPWGTVSNIEPSRHAAGTAYISVDFHQVGDTNPYVYKTEDYGQHWRSIAANLPRDVFGYVHVVREDPTRAGVLYLGTENAVWASFDDGALWRHFQFNLPHAPVHWLQVQEHFNDLVVATYGRGFWIMDDITPVQQMTEEIMEADLHFFEPRPAYRFHMKEASQSQPEDPGAGRNPRYGASLNFYLGSVPEEGVTLTILDSGGDTIRTVRSGEGLHPGINRLYWDLRHESSATPRLRTPPEEHSHVELGERGWRPLGEGGRVSPLAAPGVYGVVLTAGGRELRRELEVLKDPSSTGSLADIEAQLDMLLRIRGSVNEVVELIDRIEMTRRQILDLLGRLHQEHGYDEVVAAGEALEQALREVEGNLFDLRLTGGTARQDTLRWPRRLYAKLTSLAGYVSSADYPPTEQAREVYRGYLDQLAELQGRMRTLEEEEISAFNRILSERGIAPIVPGEASARLP